MSDIQTHIGKLKKVDLGNNTIEEYFEKRCKELGIEKESYQNSYIEAYSEEKWPVVPVIIGDEVYEVVENKELEYCGEIADICKCPDGTYHYVMQFYDGGTCLPEMLQDALTEQLIKEKTN